MLVFNCVEGNPGSPYLSSISCPSLSDSISIYLSRSLTLWLAFTLSVSLYICSHSLSRSLALSRAFWMNNMWKLWLRRYWANSVSLSNLCTICSEKSTFSLLLIATARCISVLKGHFLRWRIFCLLIELSN